MGGRAMGARATGSERLGPSDWVRTTRGVRARAGGPSDPWSERWGSERWGSERDGGPGALGVQAMGSERLGPERLVSE